LDPGVSTGLFRILQEALTNIARHAEATAIAASICVKDRRLVLRIFDNGKGFEVNAVRKKKTLGLLGMKERTLMMNGVCEIVSQPGKGTSLSVSVPLIIPDQ
jgi:signal transduction histidine kinase